MKLLERYCPIAVVCAVLLFASACGEDAATPSKALDSDVRTAGGRDGDAAPATAGRASPRGGDGASAAAGSGGSGGDPVADGGDGAGSGGSNGNAAGSSGAAPMSSAGAPGSTAGSPGSSAAGSGGANMRSDTPATTPPALGPDCAADPLASKRPYGSGFFQKFTGLFGCTAPADVALLRKMLPEKLEMPADPQVCFYTIDFEISGVGRYHEAAILIPSTYKGQNGKYVLTMDLDNAAATSGGRAIGFPKYQGQVSVEQHGNDWVGTASANGAADLKATYTGECNKTDEFQWPDFFNITPIPSGTPSTQAFLPPRTGDVLMVPAEFLEPPTFYSLKGSVKVEINDKLPWNGVFDETKPFPGLLTKFVGGINLGNKPLD